MSDLFDELKDKDMEERFEETSKLWQALSAAANTVSDTQLKASMKNSGQSVFKDPEVAKKELINALKRLQYLESKRAEIISISQALADLEKDIETKIKNDNSQNRKAKINRTERVAYWDKFNKSETTSQNNRYVVPEKYKSFVSKYFTGN